MSTTRMNLAFAANELTELPVQEKCWHTPSRWAYPEFVYNVINTALSTFISNATLITYLAILEPEILGMNWLAIYISLPIALVLGLCEAYSHWSQSNHIARAEQIPQAYEALELQAKDDIEASTDLLDLNDEVIGSLTVVQKVSAAIHYTSDVLQGATLPLLTLSQLPGAISSAPLFLKNPPMWGRFAACGVTLLFSALGNKRELDNTITSMREENKEKSHYRLR